MQRMRGIKLQRLVASLETACQGAPRAYSTASATVDAAKEQAAKASGLPWSKIGAGAGAVLGLYTGYKFMAAPAPLPAPPVPAPPTTLPSVGGSKEAQEPVPGHEPAPTSKAEEDAVPTHPDTDLPVLPPNITAVDHEGNKFELDSIKGDFALLTFGSRTEKELTLRRLNHLEEIVRQSDRKTNMQYMRALFMVDEPGETPAELKDLLGSFAKTTSSERAELRVVGLSGPELSKARAAVNAFRHLSPPDKAEADHHNMPPKDYATPDGTLFLVDPEGAIVAAWDELHDLGTLSNAVAEHIFSYQKAHQAWHGPKAVRRRYA